MTSVATTPEEIGSLLTDGEKELNLPDEVVERLESVRLHVNEILATIRKRGAPVAKTIVDTMVHVGEAIASGVGYVIGSTVQMFKHSAMNVVGNVKEGYKNHKGK